MGNAANNENGERARVTFRRVQRRRSGGENLLTVLCPRRMQIFDLAECRNCQHSRGLSLDPAGREIFLRCSWQSGHEQATLGAEARSDVLSTIMTAPATCLPEHADLHTAIGLFVEHDISAIPVVDANGRAVGIVTKTDALRWHHEHQEAAQQASAERPPMPGVRQVMSHVVFTLHAESDISHAAAVMAYEGIHHVVITSADGRAFGIVTALDIMGWLARRSGYVIVS